MNKNILLYFFIILISTILSVYICEYYLNLTTYDKSGASLTRNKLENKIKVFENQNKKKYDKRSFIDIFEENNYSNKIFFPMIAGKKKINFKDKFLFPLAGHSNIKNIYCNENGYYSTFVSDRYGFNNNNENWDFKRIDFLLLGDSFIHGMCVNKPDDISSQLEILSGGISLNLSYGGNGPISQYASLKEYSKNKKINYILWFFYEGNDLNDLNEELKNNILFNYVSNDNFEQKLINYQPIIDKYAMDYQNENFKKITNFKTKLKKIFIPYRTINLIKNLALKKDKKIINYREYKKILNKALIHSKTSNSRFIFIYLPEYARYTSEYKFDNIKREKVLNIVKNLSIPIIDIHKELFVNEKDKLIYFPLRNNGHYNEIGYAKIANIIYKKVLNYEY